MSKKNIKEFEFDIFLEFVNSETHKWVLIGIEHFPCKYDDLENRDYNSYFKEKGSTFFFEYNGIFTKYNDNKKISEIRIIDEKNSVSFTDDGNILRLKANNKYKNVENRLKKEFPENEFVYYQKKIDEFEITKNKLVLTNYKAPVFMGHEMIGYEDNENIYDCANGTYEVYSLIIENKNNYEKRYNDPPPPYGYAIKLQK